MTPPKVTTFYREALAGGEVFHLHGSEGAPAADVGVGHAMPFWSTRARAQRVVAKVPKFAGYDVEAVRLDLWRERWLVNLDADGFLIGLNWTPPHAGGVSMHAADVARELREVEQALRTKAERPESRP